MKTLWAMTLAVLTSIALSLSVPASDASASSKVCRSIESVYNVDDDVSGSGTGTINGTFVVRNISKRAQRAALQVAVVDSATKTTFFEQRIWGYIPQSPAACSPVT